VDLVVKFFLIGFVAGAVTGIPIGPVNVAIIDAAYRDTLRRAIAVGVGGAIADGLFALLGVLGVTRILKAHPAVPPILYAVSGLVLIGFGILTARSRPVAPVANLPRSPNPSKEIRSGITLGLTLICLNPAALLTWMVVLGPQIPGATSGESIVTCAGVLAGSAAWFSGVAVLTHKGKHLLGEKLSWINRVIGIGMVGYGGFLLVRAAREFFS
jgi:arginine exporter protein ArgO